MSDAVIFIELKGQGQRGMEGLEKLHLDAGNLLVSLPWGSGA